MLVFVFFTGTLANANSNTFQDYADCDEFAEVSQGIALLNGSSYEDSLNVFIGAYDACVEYNISILVEVDLEDLED